MEFSISSRIAAMLGPELHGVAWFLTYSIHAAVWAAAVLLISKWQPLSAAARHTAWKGALLAPFVTTLLAFAAPWTVDAERAATSRAPHATLVVLGDASAREVQASSTLATSSPGLKIDESSAHRLGRGLDVLGACVLGAAALGLARFGISAADFRRRLRRRRKLTDGPLFDLLQGFRGRLTLRAVTLSESADVDCPLVLGSAEICIPLTGLSELTDAEVEAVFAHELAHLERGDGFWFPVVGLLEAALWLHPVTRWVCAQFRQSAELACDARCVELTGRPRALALALTHIASRTVAAKRAIALPTMTQPRSGLVARVAQLTNAAGPRARAALPDHIRLMVGLCLSAVVSLGSSVRVADARAPEAERQVLSPASADSASVRELEIAQGLRHKREMQEWLEQRSVSD